MGVPKSGPAAMVEVGCLHVAQRLEDLITNAIGQEVVAQFKNKHPLVWQNIQTRIERVINILDQPTAAVRLEFFGDYLQQRNALVRTENGSGFSMVDSGTGVQLNISSEAIARAFEVITESEFFVNLKRALKTSAPRYVYIVGEGAEANCIKERIERMISRNTIIVIPIQSKERALLGAC